MKKLWFAIGLTMIVVSLATAEEGKDQELGYTYKSSHVISIHQDCTEAGFIQDTQNASKDIVKMLNDAQQNLQQDLESQQAEVYAKKKGLLSKGVHKKLMSNL